MTQRTAARTEGRATPEGTARYRARIGARVAGGHFRELRGPAGSLVLSSIGVGTYLGDDDDATDRRYEEAIARALDLGCNVLDAAINYRSMRSERAIGRALAAAFAAGTLRRDEVVVATKAGFLPIDGEAVAGGPEPALPVGGAARARSRPVIDGGRPRDPGGYLRETYVTTGVIKAEDVVAGCHAMTPRYLRDQLERSRANLGLQTIDVFYLHNPETQLGEVTRSEFVRRLRAAFEELEQAVADGAIGLFGTATWNGYRQPAAATGHLSLAEVVAIARGVGGPDHHFRVVQLPYNLAMPEAAIARNQSGRTLLEAAGAEGVYVMTSASVMQGRLTSNLPDEVRRTLGGSLASDATRALQFVRSTPGVGTALVGMARREHVEENLAVATVPPAPPEAVKALLPR